MTLKERHEQVRRDSENAARRDLPGRTVAGAGALADVARDQAAQAERQVQDRPARSSQDPAVRVWGVPDDFRIIGPEGSIRAVNRWLGVAPALQFTGQVFMGETLTLSTGMKNSDSKFLGNGSWAEMPHQVKVTWRLSCNGTITTLDRGQVVMAPSSTYQAIYKTPVPYVSTTVTLVPEFCPNLQPDDEIAIEARGEVIDTDPAAGDRAGGMPLVPQFATAIADAETAGCAIDCSTTGFAQPQAIRNGTVNTATGTFSLGANDLVQASPGGGWTAGRTYSSVSDPSAPSVRSAASGSMGPGWRVPWDTRLQKDGTTGDITLVSPTGSVHRYADKGGGSYAAASASRSVLRHLDAGGYSLTTLDKRVLTFDESGRFLSEKDRSGQGETYTYTGDRVTAVDGTLGPIATLKYTGELLTQITRADGQTVAYGYTNGLLTSVTGGGTTTTYEYDTASRLNSVKDGNGRPQIRNTYDAQSRVISQTDPTGAAISYVYTGGETDVTMPDGGVWTDIHSRNHLFTQYDPFGNRTEYVYDGRSNVTRITDPAGNVVSSTYSPSGLLTSRTDPVGSASYSYNAEGDLTSSKDANGKTTTYGYDTGRRLNSVKDPLGNTSTFTYTSAGQVASATTALGNVWQYQYDAAGNLAVATTPLGAKTTSTFNRSGLPLTVTDPRGNAGGADAAAFTTTYTYDDGNRVLSVKDPNGKTATNSYDKAGNLKTATDASGRTTTYAYDAANRPVSTTDAAGRVTLLAYDGRGQVVARTDATGAKTTYVYDKAGRVTSMTTPRGNAAGADPAQHTWKYGYDKAGNRTSVTDPGGRTISTTYDAADRPIEVADPVGNVSKTAYDKNGNLTGTTDALGKTTSYTYDSVGRLASVKDANARTLTYGYDADGNRTSETTPLGATTTYAYDAAGRQISRTDPRGNVAGATPAQFTWMTSYDAAGNVTGETDPLGNKVTRAYDALSNLIGSTDPHGRQTSYGYDSLSRLIQTTAPDGGVTKAAFDTAGNVISQTDANQRITKYEYDNAGRRTKVTDPLDRSVRYTYDPDGNLATVVNARGLTLSHIYDSRGLLTSRTHSDGTPSATYTYDDAQRLTGVTDGAGTRTIAYDAAGRPTSITAPGSANPFKYTYLPNGLISSRTYPDGRATTYTYDADGHMAAQKQNGRATTYAWDPSGNLLSATLPTTPALTESRVYDRVGRLASISEGAAERQFERDGAGRVTSEVVKTTTDTSLPKRFEYDAAGRLTRTCTDTTRTQSCVPGTTGERYTYDKVGNRLTAAAGASTTTNTYDAADQLTTSTTGTAVATLAYDADGNQTKDSAGTYTYDALDRVKTAGIGTDTYTFAYDADGNRTSVKKNATLLRSYQWDVNAAVPRLATERGGDSALLGDYHYGPSGEPQALDTGASSSFFLHDRQNSVTSVRDLTAVETHGYAYDTWGAATGRAGGGSKQQSPFGFNGAVKDAVLDGRIQLPARSYDPRYGRFTTADPRPDAAVPANKSTYAYANNDPVNQSDPTGACPLCVSAGVGAALGAVVEGGIYSWQHRDGGFSGSGLAKAAGRGALIGGIGGLLMPGAGNLAARSVGLVGGRALVTSTAVNAGVGAGFSYAVNAVHCRPTDPWDLLIGATGGAGSSLVGPAFDSMRTPLRSGATAARTPVGGRGRNLNVVPSVGRTAHNAPTTISGRDYVGHALDQMQSRGIMPSAVEDAIQHGQFMVGKRSGTSAYYSSANDLTIITDTESGRVITAVWGFVKQ
ncbi:RHS repeat-associated core domain-containing protein [Streptomyces goshikiensis]